MTNDLIKLSNAENTLAEAKTPEQSKEVESLASAAKAWAKERGNYEMLVNSMHLWIMARR